MPDAFGQDEDLRRLHEAITNRWEAAEEVTADLLAKRFPSRQNLIYAWRLPGVIEELQQDLIVAVDVNFPWSLPLIALPEPVNAITIPHIEFDGRLCLAPTAAPFDLPIGIEHVEQLVQDANDVLMQGCMNTNDADFYSEAQSYWGLVLPSTTELWLAEPPPTSHVVWSSAMVGNNFVMAADKSMIVSWGKASARQVVNHQPALILQIPKPLHPRDYPLTMRDLVETASNIGAVAELHEAISKWRANNSLPIVLIFEHEGSLIHLGAIFMAPGSIRLPGAQQNGIPGFRHNLHGSVRARLNALSKVSVRFPHLRVVPIYREFLQNRTAGAAASLIVQRRIIIAGCGALGGQLAVHLAQAGIDHLTLLDAENLDWRNVGRHVLDSRSVGYNKAVALAKVIRCRFPDSRVEGFAKTWEEYRRTSGADFDSADLLISVTGEAAGNLHLDALSADGDIPPVVFGWVEPFAVAAHAVLRHPMGDGLADICSASGLLLEPVVDRGTAPPLPQDPSCGAFYQPFSSLNALPSIGLLGDLVLDALLDRVQSSTHRIWVGGPEEFYRNGLSIHPTWHNRLNAMGYHRRFEIILPCTK